MTNPDHPNEPDRWWKFIAWLWQMCRHGQRTWEHPRNEEEVLELKATFEKNFPDWKRGETTPSLDSAKDGLPEELPF